MASVVVHNLAGDVITRISPIPCTVGDVKKAIECKGGFRFAQCLQRLSLDTAVLADDFALPADESLVLRLCLTELPFFSWDFEGNTACDEIVCDGGDLRAPNLRSKFINVVTQEPIRNGLHYFQFVVHSVNGEKRCGIVADKSQAGNCAKGDQLQGCFYYSGHSGTHSLRFGNNIITRCDGPNDGDIIDMLVDFDAGALAFGLNGSLQCACEIYAPQAYLFTTVCGLDDHVELRKLSPYDAPSQLAQAIKGQLLACVVMQSVEDGW